MAPLRPEMIHACILPAVRRLPRQDGVSDDDVAAMAFNASVMLLPRVSSDALRFRKVGTPKAASLLAELRDKLVQVAQAIDTLPIEGQAALNEAVKAIAARRVANEAKGQFSLRDHAPDPLAFAVTATVMAEATTAALDAVQAGPQTHGHKPPKRFAAAVADRAVLLFEQITGKTAGVTTDPVGAGHKAGGAFLAFVTDLFEVLGIDASPESQVRAAIARAKSPRRLVG